MGNLSELLPQQSETVKAIYKWHEDMRKGKEGPWRGRLGASIIGQPCERKLWYTFRGLYEEQFEGRVVRLFETGHLEEPRFVKELRAIGCEVHDKDEKTGRQYEFTALGGHFVDHPDAMALGILEAPKTWHVCEFKTYGGTEDTSKDFEKVKKDGVKKVKPEHYAQMMVGMGLIKLKRAYYLCKKKATDDLHDERVRYDATEFKALMDKAERIITSVQPPERCTTRPDYYYCKWCKAYELCWGTGKVAVPIPTKTCRSCCHATPEMDGLARWSCKKRELKDLSYGVAFWLKCDHHLLLPDLVSFAEPVDGCDDWIEFKNKEDGFVWRHGNGKGMWKTEDLMRMSALCPLDDEKELTLIEQYPPEVCELVWHGKEEDLGVAISDHLAEHWSRADVDFADYEDDAHEAWEYGGQHLAVIYKGEDCAAIWKGKK